MIEVEKPLVTLSPPQHIGFVVKSVDRAIDHYRSNFGWGPFNIFEMEMEDFKYRGKPGNCRLKIAIAQTGPVQVEFIEVLDGESPHTEFLQEKGEGMHHLCYEVESLDRILADLADKGMETALYQDYPDRGLTVAYVDSTAVGGIMLELIERRG